MSHVRKVNVCFYILVSNRKVINESNKIHLHNFVTKLMQRDLIEASDC